MSRIFISYKRQDKDVVFPIVEEIKQKTGVDCWIDLEGIESGDQFQNVIIDAIDNADIVVFMLSKNFIAPYKDEITGEIDLKKQTFPEKEVMYALRHDKRLVPISIDGTTIYDCKWLEFNCSGLDCVKWFQKEENEKFLLNLLGWTCKKICIIGEYSSGKTSIARIINEYFKKKGEYVNSTLNSNDSYIRNSHISIEGIGLFGNYVSVKRLGQVIKIFDIAVMPSIKDFTMFISKVDGVFYVKNIQHFQLTPNDIYRISQIYDQNKPFNFVFTHCDSLRNIEIENVKSYIEGYLCSNGIRKQSIEYVGLRYNINRINTIIEEMITIICNDRT